MSFLTRIRVTALATTLNVPKRITVKQAAARKSRLQSFFISILLTKLLIIS